MLRLTSSFTARALTECVLLALTMIVSTRPASAAVPPLMNYQGYLTDVSDQPVSGSHAMSFALYADSTGGTALWSESYASVQVVAGVFNVLLGSVTPLQPSLFTGAVLWIQTEIEAVDIQPRRPLVTVAYSFNSQRADTAQFVADPLWQTDGTNVYRLTGNVGIGTASPAEKLEVAGIIHSTSGGIEFPDGTIQTTAAGPAPSVIRSVQSGEVNLGQGGNNATFNLTIAPVDPAKAFCIVGGVGVCGATFTCGARLTSSTNLQIKWYVSTPCATNLAIWQVVEFN